MHCVCHIAYLYFVEDITLLAVAHCSSASSTDRARNDGGMEKGLLSANCLMGLTGVVVTDVTLQS